MNPQSLKLSLIDWLIHLNDEKLINEVQSIRKKDFVNHYEAGLKSFSKEEILKRIEASEEDFKNNKTISLEDFIAETDKW
jgi:hypothetical protein